MFTQLFLPLLLPLIPVVKVKAADQHLCRRDKLCLSDKPVSKEEEEEEAIHNSVFLPSHLLPNWEEPKYAPHF